MGEMMRFLVIEQNADVVVIDHDPNTEGGTLKMLQTAVDGLIKCVPADPDFLGFDADVWVNEEGLYREDYRLNVLASVISCQTLVGPAVLSLYSAEGETVGLDDHQIDKVGDQLVVRMRTDETEMADVLNNLYEIGGPRSVYDYVNENHRDWSWTFCDPCEDVTPTWALPEGSICAVCFSVKEERES